MPGASEVLSAALTRLANDRRNRVTAYVNAGPNRGRSGVPARLLNDIGFLRSTQFTYVNANPAHVVPPEGDAPRTIDRVLIVPYGVNSDYTRLTSTNPRNRLIAVNPTDSAFSGLTVYPDNAEILVPAYVTPVKTPAAVRNMVNRLSGPSYHYLVDRLGNIIVGPGLDNVVTAGPSEQDRAIVIGIEGALGITTAGYALSDSSAILELPLTALQLITLATLFNKLLTAFPNISATIRNAPPVQDVYYARDPRVPVANFSNGAWRSTGTILDYGNTDTDNFFEIVTNQGAFDLATEVFRSNETTQVSPPVASREEARQVIGEVDTAGEQSILLAAYADLAAPERSYAMLEQTRRDIFQLRTESTHVDANQAGVAAAYVSNAGTVLPIQHVVQNSLPHVYDYATGLWGDGRPT